MELSTVLKQIISISNTSFLLLHFLVLRPKTRLSPPVVSILLSPTNFIDCAIANPYVVDPKRNVSCQGIVSSPGIETFLGIPYGEDKSGVRRLAPPQPFSPPPGYIFNATSAGASCLHASGGGFLYETNVTYISEDCLSLQLARPAQICNDMKLPVMVYIYGGILRIQHSAFSIQNPT